MKTVLQILLVLSLGVVPGVSLAQGGGRGFLQDGAQRVEALRTSFITRELSLTPDEAKTFWPLYEAREAELSVADANESLNKTLDEVKKLKKEHLVEIKSFTNPSDVIVIVLFGFPTSTFSPFV
jgi:hypothetical protein